MFNVETLFLDDEYTVDVKVNYSVNFCIAGILKISNKKILLEVFGETNSDKQYNYKEYFDSMECTNWNAHYKVDSFMYSTTPSIRHSYMGVWRYCFQDTHVYASMIFDEKI